jgi:hypothetical protein
MEAYLVCSLTVDGLFIAAVAVYRLYEWVFTETQAKEKVVTI